MKAKFQSILFSVILLSACHSPKVKEEQQKPIMKKASPLVTVNKQITNDNDSIDENNAIYYIVVADTNKNYDFLNQKMIGLSKQLNIPVDLMGRSYNKKKNLIALPENDPDEIYAGDYFPRRSPSENLSLEYLNTYHPQSHEKMIALVTGIYGTEKSADSALIRLKTVEKQSFKIKANVYIGCMH